MSRNSADITRKVLAEARALAGSLIAPAVELLSNVCMVVVYLGFMLYLEPEISLIAGGILIGAYLVTFRIIRPILEDLGRQQVRSNKRAFRTVSEAGTGYKEVKLHGLEHHYAARFRVAAFKSASAVSKAVFLNHAPRFVIEAVFFGLLLGIVVVFFLRGDGSLLAAVPTLGALGFSAMRLLPSLQAVYGGLAKVREGTARLDSVHSDYMANARDVERRKPPVSGALDFEERLKLMDVGYTYPGTHVPSLKDFSLEIPVKTTVGIVGGTGAGKTTIVDLILGLLPAGEGELSVDGTVLTSENIRSWQHMVGYVPQSIFLIDDSVAQNIAFGIRKDQIDMDRVRHVAKVAALSTFIETELPDGYDTAIGEQGVRLSGGQRQRIGIARALYREPKLLVMDEATSALDNITERVVMEAIHALRDDFTIILIAHRLSTVRECDNIVMMERGRILAQGPYDALLKESEAFQELATGT